MELYYSEWVTLDSNEELEEAKIYLNLWKKFFLKKIGNPKVVAEQLVIKNRDDLKLPFSENVNWHSVISIKFCVKQNE